MADLRARAFWIVAPGRSEIREEPLAPQSADEVLVRTVASGVSRGTESLVFAGRVPVSLHETMRCPFQAGSFPGPVKYGYMSVGRVEAGPDALLDRLVFCLHPHQDLYVVPASAVTPLPPDLPPHRALLAANMETALNGLWDAPPLAGDRIAVVGCGVVGGLAATLASRIPGVELEVIDPAPARRDLAARLGLRHVQAEEATGDADLVIHASGTAEGLATALRLAGTEATVLELSWYGEGDVPVPLGEVFHPRRLRLLSSQVGMVAAAKRARWDNRRRLELALRLLADPLYDAFLTSEGSFDSLPETMPRLAASRGDALCHLVRYG